MCFSGNDASAKYAITVGHLPVAEVVWVRFLGQLAAIILALGLFAIPSLLRANKPGGAAPGSEGGSGAAGWLRRQ